jgi:hypothetical protein
MRLQVRETECVVSCCVVVVIAGGADIQTRCRGDEPARLCGEKRQGQTKRARQAFIEDGLVWTEVGGERCVNQTK